LGREPLTGDAPTIEFCLEVIQGSGRDTISFLIFLGDFWALGWKNFSPVSLDDREESFGNVVTFVGFRGGILLLFNIICIL